MNALQNKPREFPLLVTIKGVLTRGELSAGIEWWRVENKPADNKFLYLDAHDLATAGKIYRNFNEASIFLISAFEEKYLENIDETKEAAKVAKLFNRKKKEDFLCFYGDEHTHLWYALQWFASAALLTTMTIYRSWFLARKWRF